VDGALVVGAGDLLAQALIPTAAAATAITARILIDFIMCVFVETSVRTDLMPALDTWCIYCVVGDFSIRIGRDLRIIFEIGLGCDHSGCGEELIAGVDELSGRALRGFGKMSLLSAYCIRLFSVSTGTGVMPFIWCESFHRYGR